MLDLHPPYSPQHSVAVNTIKQQFHKLFCNDITQASHHFSVSITVALCEKCLASFDFISGLFFCRDKIVFLIVWVGFFKFQAEKLQHDLEDVTFKLKTVEHQLNQAEELKNELQDKKEQVSALRNQLEAEKLQRSGSQK